MRLMRSWAEDIQTSTLQSRSATSPERGNTPQEQETAEMDNVEDAQPMEVDIEGKDGRRQDEGEQVRPSTRQPELDPKPAIQGILGIDLECDILGGELDADQQRLVQQPGCFGGLGARRLLRGDRGDAAYWATWDLHAKVISQLATELGRTVTKVADGGEAVAERGWNLCKAKRHSQTHG